MPDAPVNADKNSGKNRLRDEARQKKSSLTAKEIEEKSIAICARALPAVRDSAIVMVYASKNHEVATSSLIAALLGRGTRVVVPIIERDTCSLRLSYLEDPRVLVESTFSVPEPIGNEIPAEGKELRAVIVPMLAFDTRGNRLGYGAGYYDRFLAKYPGAMRIGLAFSCQETHSIPWEDDDIRMDIIITENRIIRCGRHL
ncbi:MAG TPA: 5-formyltetrahydrofolate cyclo-ligase [Methanoregula sp.]|nr:5-formyltetrahydrofolate cyclo-ligase [Methanoregula sp.]